MEYPAHGNLCVMYCYEHNKAEDLARRRSSFSHNKAMRAYQQRLQQGDGHQASKSIEVAKDIFTMEGIISPVDTLIV